MLNEGADLEVGTLVWQWLGGSGGKREANLTLSVRADDLDDAVQVPQTEAGLRLARAVEAQ